MDGEFQTKCGLTRNIHQIAILYEVAIVIDSQPRGVGIVIRKDAVVWEIEKFEASLGQTMVLRNFCVAQEFFLCYTEICWPIL